ncbi:MAG: TIM barrel protein [Verrucomicrobiota bacterium]
MSDSSSETRFSRRNWLQTGSTAAIAAAAASLHKRLGAEEEALGENKGRVNHSACKWCYKGITLEELCIAGKEFGLTSIDLLQPADFPTLKKHDYTCAMISNPTAELNGQKIGGIGKAWNRVEHHDALVEAYHTQIDASAAAGMTNVICFSGNRDGLDDEVGIENCAKGLKRIMKRAEEKGVVITMELLNSKVNHKDYQCDHTAWGVELCKAIGSDHFKLLYDIYHMQIMEGDVIATIRESKDYISHYHTGGVPGRNEIDDTQELNYPAIIRAVVETGYKGFVAQEFIPAREDKIASLRQGVEICDV